MKARMHFDTLTFANKLKAAGMDPKLAEVQALALVEAMEDSVATKIDILELRNELKTSIAELKTSIAELKTSIAELKAELVKWMIGLFVTNLTLTGTFIAFAQYLNHLH